MTVSLQEKNGFYHAVISYYDKTGKRKQKWRSTGLSTKGHNKRSADKRAKEILSQYEAAENSLTGDMPFTDLLKRWLSVAEASIDSVTYEGYKHTVNKHLLPYFENKRLTITSIKTDHIQVYIDFKATNGRLDGKGGLSCASLIQHHTVLYQALEYAINNQIITMNPARKKALKFPKAKKYKAGYYTIEEMNKLLEICDGEIIKPIVYITCCYGLRRSEVLGLKWSAIDFESKTLRIEHTKVRTFTLVCKDSTKNASSKRSYPLFDNLCDCLQKLQQEQKENKKLLGNAYHDTDYIFRWPDGRDISTDYVTHRFAAILKNNGMKKIRFHDLRGSCATMLISMGYNLKEIQDWLGHADIKMTANVYGHLDMGRKVEIGEQFNGLIAASF